MGYEAPASAAYEAPTLTYAPAPAAVYAPAPAHARGKGKSGKGQRKMSKSNSITVLLHNYSCMTRNINFSITLCRASREGHEPRRPIHDLRLSACSSP